MAQPTRIGAGMTVELKPQSDKAEPRFVVLLSGLQSHSQTTPDDHGLRDDFAPLLRRLTAADPILQPVYFSYRAAELLAADANPELAWVGDPATGAEPIYAPLDTTDRPLVDHVAALDWLLSDLMTRHPAARLDIVGFSLGGVIALAWAASVRADHPALAATHRVVLLNAPVGGVTPLGRVAAAPGVRHALCRTGAGFGRSAVLRDLQPSSRAIAGLRRAVGRLDIASVENSRDYLVNGRRITGQLLLPESVRTIPLGRGVAATGFLSADACYVDDLGGLERHLRRSHRAILKGRARAVSRAHDYVARLIVEDGPIWASRMGTAPSPAPVPVQRFAPPAGRPSRRQAVPAPALVQTFAKHPDERTHHHDRSRHASVDHRHDRPRHPRSDLPDDGPRSRPSNVC